MPLEVRAATADDVPQAIALLDTIWSWQANEAMLTRVPGYEPHQTRVGVLDGRVVGLAQVVRREMWVGERTATLGYVGNVATAAEHRRKGYASAIMRDVARYMQARDYDLGLLHAAVPEVYGKQGWQVVRERITTCDFTDAALDHARDASHVSVGTPSGRDHDPGTPGAQVTARGRSYRGSPAQTRHVARQGDWARDLEAVAAVYDEYIVGRTGAARRSPDHWRASREWLTTEDPSRFIVIEHRGEVVAYSRGQKGRSVVMEVAYRAGHADALPRLFAAIRDRYGAGPYHAYLGADPAIDAFLAKHASNVSRAPECVPDYEPAMALPLRFGDLAALDGMCFYAADHF